MGNRHVFTDSLGWANTRRHDGTEEWRKVWGGSLHRVHLVPRLDTVDLPGVRVFYAADNGWRLAFEVPFLDDAARSAFVNRLRTDFLRLCARFGHSPGAGESAEDSIAALARVLG